MSSSEGLVRDAIGAARRYAKHALAEPLIEAALSAFPPLSAAEAPPRLINIAGAGDFISAGDELVDSIVDLTGLREGQSVVDVGCGIGRSATALYRRFGAAIDYRGFDIVRFAVAWCRKHFAPLTDRYRFEHSNVENSLYNAFGRIQACDYVFPYDQATADVVVANSVFTHMQPGDVTHYVGEIARVLRVGGSAYLTFFILDADSEARIAAGQAAFSFAHRSGDCRVEESGRPDLAVAYALAWIETALAAAGLELARLERSNWRGNDSPLFQDIVIARKRDRSAAGATPVAAEGSSYSR